MRKFGLLFIVGLLLLAAQPTARAAQSSDWPSLNGDAASSNSNGEEQSLNPGNVLKLKVRWTAPDPATSVETTYPIVAGDHVYMPIVSNRKVHVQMLDARTGKRGAVYTKDAQGGILFNGGNVYLAGRILQQIDPASGGVLARVGARPSLNGGTFLNPVADSAVVVSGYVGGNGRNTLGSLYAFSPDISRSLWKVPSLRAQGTIGGGRVLTEVATGGAFYDEHSGKRLVNAPLLHSDWFAGDHLDYTVGTLKGGNATLYAFTSSGRRAWSVVVGPHVVTQPWPHAVDQSAVYVAMMKPRVGVEALDSARGRVLWRRTVPDVERLALANGLLYALTYRLGQPVRVWIMRADTGKVLGAIVLTTGYSAFAAGNGLMVADGMVYIRATGPTGPLLVALGL